MVQKQDVEMKKLLQAIRHIRNQIANASFISNHKAHIKYFTRMRTLSFQVIFMLLLRKTVKSLQVALNELFMGSFIASTVSASAYTQARKKFKHTAFIELNDDIVDIFYSDNDGIKRWKGYRCIAADGSKVILPKTTEIAKEYGTIAIKNQSIESSFSQGMFECYYDVLNNMVVKCMLAHGLSYEVNLATQMLGDMKADDLLIYDRGYASYEFIATLISQQKNYLIRCPRSSFKVVELLMQDTHAWSKIVTLEPPAKQRKQIKEKGLPLKITVRFVSVILSTGEVEVLATSLMDPSIERNEFKSLYGMRWGVETYFSRVKARLCLENFTGKTVESVKQDFWSTIFISNFETLAREDIEEEMNIDSKTTQHEKKVNAAISFNAIKNMAFDIFANNTDHADALQKMVMLFKTNPTLIRPERKSPLRKKPSYLRSYNFLRRVKKMVF